MEEVAPLVEGKLTGRDFDKGRALFAAANCFGCHRFSDEGARSARTRRGWRGGSAVATSWNRSWSRAR